MQPQHNVQQTALPPPPRKNESKLLICFGVAQLLVSVTLIFICIWIITINSNIIANYITVFCCIYSASVAILSIISGQNVIEKRCCVGTSVGLSIAGACVVNAYTLLFILGSWLRSNRACDCVLYNSQDYVDIGSCYLTESSKCDDIENIHLPILIGAGIQVLIDGIIALVGFTYLCRCCGINSSQNYVPDQVIRY